MAATVKYIFPNTEAGVSRKQKVRLMNESTATADEAAVVKVDLSALRMSDWRGNSITPSKLGITRITYSVQGFNYVKLEFDADTNDLIAILSGSGEIDFVAEEGQPFVDPQSTNFTGDVVLTTDGGEDGDMYDITLSFIKYE